LAISIPLRAERAGRLSRRYRILLGVGLTAGLLVGAVVLSRSWMFHVRGIEVSGATHVHRGRILEVAEISKRTNALWLDEGEAERRLEAQPWIADAEVDVSFPLGVGITITERTPVAVASDGIARVLIAADGTVLGRGSGRRDLPVIQLTPAASVGRPVPGPVGAARALGAMSPRLRDRVSRVSVLIDGTLEIRIGRGPKIRFGTPDHASHKARVIARILAWSQARGTRIRVLSVVSPSAPAAVLVR
jgi:cell division protein FtsQ